jgi:glycosyltransferase involved in cell wall biosynthesis
VRVVLLTRSLELGGAERQLCLLARGLKARGHDARVVSFYPGGPLTAMLTEAGVPVASPGKAGRWDLAGFAVRLTGLLRAGSPQVVYGFLDAPNLAAAWLKPWLQGAKVVWGVRASDMDLNRYDWFARLVGRLPALTAGRADLIIANSSAGAEQARRRGLPGSRLLVIPNGIDTARFVPDQASGLVWRTRWGVAPGEDLVGLAARLDPMKDLPTFLGAAAIMREARPGARFVVVGGGPQDYAEGLKALGRELGLAGALTWAGPQTDMPGIINALDLCVLSSAFGEGFPNVVGEAMACQVPCLVTEVGDAAWVAGEAGLAVPPRQPEALAMAALSLLAQTPEQRLALGRRLRARVVENFSLEWMVAATERALAGFLAAEDGPGSIPPLV